jgi:hypothetical protein
MAGDAEPTRRDDPPAAGALASADLQESGADTLAASGFLTVHTRPPGPYPARPVDERLPDRPRVAAASHGAV